MKTAHPPTGAGAAPSQASVELFPRVLCVADRSVNGRAARRQAASLCSAREGMTVVRPGWLRSDPRSEWARSRDSPHDLLVIGAGPRAYATLLDVQTPVLIARRLIPGRAVTGVMLVPVTDSPAEREAVRCAGRLAAAHGGSVTLLAAHGREAALHRELAGSARVLLECTDAAPRIVGEPLAPAVAIAREADRLSATLVVLGLGSDKPARESAARIASSITCSLLAVPAESSPPRHEG